MHPAVAIRAERVELAAEGEGGGADLADPAVDQDLLPEDVRADFAALPRSEVVPPYEELSQDADPELGPEWVTAVDEGWRRSIAAD